LLPFGIHYRATRTSRVAMPPVQSRFCISRIKAASKRRFIGVVP
jgi:hypothetical protein